MTPDEVTSRSHHGRQSRVNADWIAALRSSGTEQAAALTELRARLVRASLFALQRARHHAGYIGTGAIEALAEDCAQEALSAIMLRLHEFRGESRFTTGAYGFAVNIALTAARRERWRSVPLERLIDDAEPLRLAAFDEDRAPDPERRAAQVEVLAAIREGIDRHLTRKQGQVLRALIVDDLPLDEVVRHLGSNRNAVYKLVHDPRLALKRHLLSRGFDVKAILDLFGTGR